MIISRILGGLGNQMFQYALGRRLSLERDETLFLDLSAFDEYPLRTYTLNRYRVDAPIADAGDVMRLRRGTAWRRKSWVPRFLRPSARPETYVRETTPFQYDPSVVTRASPLYLKGYWQSERYFAPIADSLRAEFCLRDPLTPASAAMAEHMRSVDAVSVHIRRGDYVSDADANAVHGTCTLDYYRGAAEELVRRSDSPTFFVFSDDLDWVKEHVKLPGPTTYVAHNGEARDYEDMHLMSRCSNTSLRIARFRGGGRGCAQPMTRLSLHRRAGWLPTPLAPTCVPKTGYAGSGLRIV